MNRFQLRSYASRAQGESGRHTPIQAGVATTGVKAFAEHYAAAYAEDFGACVVVDTLTGERQWFERGCQ